MYKTIINGIPVIGTYNELIKLTQGFIGYPFEKVG